MLKGESMSEKVEDTTSVEHKTKTNVAVLLCNIGIVLLVAAIGFLAVSKLVPYRWSDLPFQTDTISPINSPAYDNDKIEKKVIASIYLDMGCPSCRQYVKNIFPFLKYMDIHIRVFDYPLKSDSPVYLRASTAGKCIARQSTDAYIAYMLELASLDEYNDANVNQIVKDYDGQYDTSCFNQEYRKAEILFMDNTKRYGVDSVPLTVINGRKISGALDILTFYVLTHVGIE